MAIDRNLLCRRRLGASSMLGRQNPSRRIEGWPCSCAGGCPNGQIKSRGKIVGDNASSPDRHLEIFLTFRRNKRYHWQTEAVGIADFIHRSRVKAIQAGEHDARLLEPLNVCWVNVACSAGTHFVYWREHRNTALLERKPELLEQPTLW